MELIKIAIGWLLGFIYELVNNYGVALILFTLVIKLILLPLGLKQQKLQEKYKNDQQLLSQETMKLYKEYGVSPMGGCLPLLIQLPVLFALYRVLYRPLTYMFGLADEAVAEMTAQKTAAVLIGEKLLKMDVSQRLTHGMTEFVRQKLRTLINIPFRTIAEG